MPHTITVWRCAFMPRQIPDIHERSFVVPMARRVVPQRDAISVATSSSISYAQK
jgi:hypothetical protein